MAAAPVPAPHDEPVLELRDVWFGYPSGTVLHGITMHVAPGEFVLLLGANGSGKTTLLRVALGLLEPHRGAVRLFGREATHPESRERAGYVPQRAAISPRVPATVAEVVAAGRTARGAFGFFGRADRRAAERALERVGLADLAHRRIGELSGGQQQRVLIARALASDPHLLVLDEPTAGVDRESQTRFAEVLAALARSGVAVLMVAHDVGPVGPHVDRVLLLHQGHLDQARLEDVRHQVGMYVEDHPHP